MFERKLKSFAIGIRYRPNFHIVDNFGVVIDEIVHAKKTVFNPDFFPQVARDNHNQFTLHKLDQNKMVNKLTLNDHDLVLECQTESIPNMKKLRNSFEKKIVKDVIMKHNITGIQRIGFISHFIFENKDFNNKFMNKTLSGTQKDMNDFSMTFSKRIPLKKNELAKDENNYKNVIYTINKKNGKNIEISVDFQLHFDLALTTLGQINFQNFYNNSDKYIKEDFSEWLKVFLQ